MEPRGLPEALKVEIQCHQKLAVRSPKPLALIKSSQAISTVPVMAPVSVVTAHANGQTVRSVEPMQKGPVGLQTLSVANGSSLRVAPSQVRGHLATLPVKVPQTQTSSMTRLAAQEPTVLPQVRTKTLVLNALRHEGHLHSQPPYLHSITAALSPRTQRVPATSANGQDDPTPPPSSATPPVQSGRAGVAYAIISASPSGPVSVSAATEAEEVHSPLLSSDSKVIIIQPQIPNVRQNSPEPVTSYPVLETTPIISSLANPKKEEDPEKVTFMVALGLVTAEHLEEIQRRRQERKRRSTANPAYSGLFEPERKRLMSHYLNSQLFLPARDCEDLLWEEGLEHEERCAVCEEEGDEELQPCHTCPRSFHLHCLQPAHRAPSRGGAWHCPGCLRKALNKDDMPWTQNFIQSYLMHKSVRQEERRRLRRKNIELKKEYTLVGEQDQRLTQALAKCKDLKNSLLVKQKDARASLERLKDLIRLIQREQVIQVTMMATTTTGTSLLSLPWMKSPSTAPSGGASTLLQSSIPQ
ncbi:hypothetical protein GJAV_G00156600 [Gymnothorax javanicus]|nr:hypothetical protein GJAV_G00156600 [Gymnothorax javanicus]